MKLTATDELRQSNHMLNIRGECQRIRDGWSQSERQRRAGLAAVRQHALWEAIAERPSVVATDRRTVAC